MFIKQTENISVKIKVGMWKGGGGRVIAWVGEWVGEKV